MMDSVVVSFDIQYLVSHLTRPAPNARAVVDTDDDHAQNFMTDLVGCFQKGA